MSDEFIKLLACLVSLVLGYCTFLWFEMNWEVCLYYLNKIIRFLMRW